MGLHSILEEVSDANAARLNPQQRDGPASENVGVVWLFRNTIIRCSREGSAEY